MASEKPFADLLGGFIRDSPLLPMDDYTRILFDNGLRDLHIFLKVYPVMAENETDLYHFISGSSLIPYMERLDTAGQRLFKSEFTKRIQTHFMSFPAIYPFKRILMYGIRL